MSDRTCLNPRCSRDVPTIGVCLQCANSTYNPDTDGIQSGEIETPGWGNILRTIS